jgi:hypothetical protein
MTSFSFRAFEQLTALRALILCPKPFVGEAAPLGRRMLAGVRRKMPRVSILVAEFVQQVTNSGENPT